MAVNNVTTCESLFKEIYTGSLIPLGIANILISAVAGIANFAIIFVIMRTRTLRSKSNVFLGSLALADFFSGTLLATVTYAELFSDLMRENCSVDSARRFLTGLILCWTLSNFVTVGYDRYIHMKTLQNYHVAMRWTKVYILLTISWIIPVGIPPLRFIGTDETVYNFVLIIYMSVYAAALVYFYILLLYHIASRKRVAPRELGRTTSSRKISRFSMDRFVAGKTVIVIITLFFLAIIPIAVYFFLVLIEKYAPDSTPMFFPKAKGTFYATAITIAIGHSAVDPITFYVRNKDIRRHVNLSIVSHITFNIMWVTQTTENGNTAATINLSNEANNNNNNTNTPNDMCSLIHPKNPNSAEAENLHITTFTERETIGTRNRSETQVTLM